MALVDWRNHKDGLKAQFAADIQGLLDGLPDRWIVTYGYRTEAEQTALYKIYLAGGPKAAAPGKSPHEFGLAVDVAHLLDNHKADYDTANEVWQRLFEAVKKHPRLHSGISFGDGDHIERYQWAKHKSDV